MAEYMEIPSYFTSNNQYNRVSMFLGKVIPVESPPTVLSSDTSSMSSLTSSPFSSSEIMASSSPSADSSPMMENAWDNHDLLDNAMINAQPKLVSPMPLQMGISLAMIQQQLANLPLEQTSPVLGCSSMDGPAFLNMYDVFQSVHEVDHEEVVDYQVAEEEEQELNYVGQIGDEIGSDSGVQSDFTNESVRNASPENDVIMYQGRNLLDLASNLRKDPWELKSPLVSQDYQQNTYIDSYTYSDPSFLRNHTAACSDCGFGSQQMSSIQNENKEIKPYYLF